MTNSPRRSARARPNSRPLSASTITSAPGAARPAITALPRAPTRTTSKRGGIMAGSAAFGAEASARAASLAGLARSGGVGAGGIASCTPCPALPCAAPGPDSASGARIGWDASFGWGAQSPRQPRKTNKAKTSSKAGTISFLAVNPPDWLTFILLPPGRGNGGEHPLPMLWMPFMTSRCHVLGPQHGPWQQ